MNGRLAPAEVNNGLAAEIELLATTSFQEHTTTPQSSHRNSPEPTYPTPINYSFTSPDLIIGGLHGLHFEAVPESRTAAISSPLSAEDRLDRRLNNSEGEKPVSGYLDLGSPGLDLSVASNNNGGSYLTPIAYILREGVAVAPTSFQEHNATPQSSHRNSTELNLFSHSTPTYPTPRDFSNFSFEPVHESRTAAISSPLSVEDRVGRRLNNRVGVPLAGSPFGIPALPPRGGRHGKVQGPVPVRPAIPQGVPSLSLSSDTTVASSTDPLTNSNEDKFPNNSGEGSQKSGIIMNPWLRENLELRENFAKLINVEALTTPKKDFLMKVVPEMQAGQQLKSLSDHKESEV